LDPSTSNSSHRLHAALAVPVPLVLPGSCGICDEQIIAASRGQMTKINVTTHLDDIFTTALRPTLRDDPTVVGSRKNVSVGRQSPASQAGRMISLFSDAQMGERR
jgi:fructose-bisphosphate aldolase, class II